MFEAEQTNQDAAPEDTQGAGQSEVSNEAPQGDESILNSDSGEEGQQQIEEENDEIEVDGKKFALPKSAAEKLQAERMMQADYTRKTQELAEQRRTSEASIQKQRQEQQQYITEIAKVVSIDDQLAELSKIDLSQYVDSDPVGVQRIMLQKQALEGQRNQAVNALEQKRQQNALNEQQAFAKQVQEAEAYFSREISGWKPERSNQLKDYAVAKGIPAEAAARFALMHPAFAKILHESELYNQIAKKPVSAAAPAPQAKPAAKVGGNATVKKDPTKMSDAEFAEYRRRTSQRRK
jgi:hypothetical protein